MGRPDTGSRNPGGTDRRLFYDWLAATSGGTGSRTGTRLRRLALIFAGFLAHRDIRGQLFLDVGSGGGHFSAAASARGARVVSLDIGLHLLRQVRARCRSSCVVGDVLRLPFAQSVFDVVCCTEVIEHTVAPLAAIPELCRVLKPGGALVVTTPCSLWQPVVRLATRLRLRPYRGYENFVWPSQLRAVVAAHGVEAVVIGFNFCPVFARALDPLFVACDRLWGRRLPWLMVNVGLVGLKRLEDEDG